LLPILWQACVHRAVASAIDNFYELVHWSAAKAPPPSAKSRALWADAASGKPLKSSARLGAVDGDSLAPVDESPREEDCTGQISAELNRLTTSQKVLLRPGGRADASGHNAIDSGQRNELQVKNAAPSSAQSNEASSSAHSGHEAAATLQNAVPSALASSTFARDAAHPDADDSTCDHSHSLQQLSRHDSGAHSDASSQHNSGLHSQLGSNRSASSPGSESPGVALPVPPSSHFSALVRNVQADEVAVRLRSTAESQAVGRSSNAHAVHRRSGSDHAWQHNALPPTHTQQAYTHAPVSLQLSEEQRGLQLSEEQQGAGTSALLDAELASLIELVQAVDSRVSMLLAAAEQDSQQQC
jgi:hypothetical protein